MPDAPTPLDLDGVGWYEVTHPTAATTLLAYVHEDGSVYFPETNDGQVEFALAAARGHVHRLVRADDAEAEVARLHTRPAPAWDEEAVQAEVLGIDARHHFHGTACLCGFDSHGRARSATEHITSAVLAVVRRHLPVKPGREDVARALAVSDVHHPDFCDCGQPVCGGTCDVEGEDCFCAAERCDGLEQQINAVLSLLPGRSEAEVKAEAWDEGYADYLEGPAEMANPYRAAEGGADRG